MTMQGIKTAVVLRHGRYKRNLRETAQGDAAREAAKTKYDPADDYKLGLDSEGKNQIRLARVKLAMTVGAFDLCLSSPYLRARESAGIVVGDKLDIVLDPNLRERDLGDFVEIPSEVFYEDYKESAAEKIANPLDWVPKNGETLRQAGARAILAVIRAESFENHETALFSAHADVAVSLRSRPEFLGLTTPNKLKTPLCNEIPNPQKLQNAQFDIYTREDPTSGKVHSEMAFFRSIASDPEGTPFDTGWLKIER